MRYRKKPVEVEAFRYGYDKLPTWFIKQKDINVFPVNDITCIIKTLEGNMIVSLGDYVIKGVNGELYPCKKDIFDKTYEKCD